MNIDTKPRAQLMEEHNIALRGIIEDRERLIQSLWDEIAYLREAASKGGITVIPGIQFHENRLLNLAKGGVK